MLLDMQAAWKLLLGSSQVCQQFGVPIRNRSAFCLKNYLYLARIWVQPHNRQIVVAKTGEHSTCEIQGDIPGCLSSHFLVLTSNQRHSQLRASSLTRFHLPHAHSLPFYLFSSSSWFSSSIFSFCIPSTRARARWRFPSASVTYCSNKKNPTHKSWQHLRYRTV